eukprot:1695592-Prymnesium_polylepis.1
MSCTRVSDNTTTLLRSCLDYPGSPASPSRLIGAQAQSQRPRNTPLPLPATEGGRGKASWTCRTEGRKVT